MSNKIKLTIVTYKVPIERDNTPQGYKETESDYSKLEVKNTDELEIESMLALPEKAREIGQFNSRQVEYLIQDSTKDYILKKIIQKHN